MLEPACDLVSDAVADASLRDAENELTRVVQPLSRRPAQSRTTPNSSVASWRTPT